MKCSIQKLNLNLQNANKNKKTFTERNHGGVLLHTFVR